MHENNDQQVEGGFKQFTKRLNTVKMGWLPPVLAIILFVGALTCFMESIGAVTNLAQPLMGVLISLVLVGTFCWEWKVFGSPTNAMRFAAHIVFGASLFFMINALFAENPEKDNLVGNLLTGTEKLIGFLIDSPIVMSGFDVLSSPGIALLFLVTCLAFAIPRRDVALGVFTVAAAVVLVIGLMKGGMEHQGFFLLGLVLLSLGCWILYENRDRAIFWKVVRKKIGNDPALRGDTELKARLLNRFLETRTPETGRACCGLVARTLGIDSSEPEAKQATVRVVRQMIDEDKLAVLTYPNGVAALAPHPDLIDSVRSDGWTMVGRSVKVLIVALISLAWILSPIDLIPDQIPIVGVLDDVLVGILGGSVVSRGINFGRGKSEALAVLDE